MFAVLKSRFVKRVVSLIFLQLLVACGGSSSPSPGKDPATVQSLNISPFDITLFDSDIKQLELKAFYSDNSVDVVTDQAQWSSSDDNVVTVDAAGIITAQSIGTVKISAQYKDQLSSVNVIVSAAVVTEIEVQPQSVKLPAGTERLLSVTGLYSDASSHVVSQGISWSSANDNTATVSSSGLVHAVAPGVVDITASFSGIDKIVSVEVTAAALVSITTSPSSLSLALGEENDLTVLGQFTDGQVRDITSQADLVTVNPGIVTFEEGYTGRLVSVSTGSTSLLVSLGNVSQQVNVTVTDAVIEQLQLSATKNSIPLGTGLSLSVIARLSDDSTRNVTEFVDWSSSDQAIASVSSSAVLQSIAKGTVTISAVYAGHSASVSFQINDAVLSTIEIAPLIQNLPVGITQPFTATGIYSDQSVQDITDQVVWLSSDDNTLFVSNAAGHRGEAVAKSKGAATVTAMKNSVTGDVLVTVTDAVLSSISVQPESTVVPIGVSETFTALAQYSDGSTRDITDDASWSSSDVSIADKVDPDSSEFTGKLQDSVTISATFENLNGFATLQVSDAVLSSVSIDVVQTVFAKGLQQQFYLTGHYSDASIKDLTEDAQWRSSDTTIASVNTVSVKGLVQALQLGSTTLSATVGGFVSEITLTVTDAVLSSITISASAAQLTVGQWMSLTAQALFSDSTTQDVTEQVVWHSTDASIASVSNTEPAKGQITALAAGIVDISAELQLVSSNVLPLTVVFDPDVPVSVSTVAQPNAILNDGSDSSVITATIKPAGSSGVIADGTEVDFIITENGLQTTLTKTTVNGVASHTLTSTQTGLIAIETVVKNHGFTSTASILSVSDFYDVIIKSGFFNPDTDGTYLYKGSSFGLLAQNISNRDFNITEFFVTNNGVPLPGSPYDGSGISNGVLSGGELFWLIYQLTEDIIPNGLVTGIQLYDPDSASNFGYQVNFAL